MKTIDVGNGFVSLIDDDDYELLSKYRWHIIKGYSTNYARAYIYHEGKKAVKERMHRILLGATETSQYVDHIDGNGLNNQKSNLRMATPSQNSFNRSARKDSKYGIKGVTFHAGKWQARITKNYKRINLGHFDTIEEAAKAYDSAALIYHQEFTRQQAQ